eukprot:scaffold54022_cov49-Attheya_sp.AAC.3
MDDSAGVDIEANSRPLDGWSRRWRYLRLIFVAVSALSCTFMIDRIYLLYTTDDFSWTDLNKTRMLSKARRTWFGISINDNNDPLPSPNVLFSQWHEDNAPYLHDSSPEDSSYVSTEESITQFQDDALITHYVDVHRPNDDFVIPQRSLTRSLLSREDKGSSRWKSYFGTRQLQGFTPPQIGGVRFHNSHVEDNIVVIDSNSGSNKNKSDELEHGWVPDVFPNPKLDPVRCGTAELRFIQGGAEERRFEVEQNKTREQQIMDDETDPLMLCDPDEVLGVDALNRVAFALRNFSAVYGSQVRTHQEKKEKTSSGSLEVGHRKEWDVSIQQQNNTEGRTNSNERIIDDSGKTWTGEGHPNDLHDETTIDTDNVYPKADIEPPEKLRPRHLRRNDHSLLSDFSKEAISKHARRILEESSSPVEVAGEHFGNLLPEFPPVQIAVAAVRKMDLQTVLRADSYYAYEDEDDMVNDAAQYFARQLHDAWWHSNCLDSEENCGEHHTNGILIFLSIMDRVCFISTGPSISATLPWWRLEHAVAQMKPDLRRRDYEAAILHAIDILSEMLESGPPSMSARVNDFVARFGVVIVFAIATFSFATWGEYRDRRKRWMFAESRSRLTGLEKEKARLLQRGYENTSCPICLEPFVEGGLEDCDKFGSYDTMAEEDDNDNESDDDSENSFKKDNDDGKHKKSNLPRVDSYGIPLIGSDDLPLKMLRCGHIFDETCWKCWIDSGQGNPCKCPVCRQDVSGIKEQDDSPMPSPRPSPPPTTTSNHGNRISVGMFSSDSSLRSPSTRSMNGNRTPLTPPETFSSDLTWPSPLTRSNQGNRTPHGAFTSDLSFPQAPNLSTDYMPLLRTHPESTPINNGRLNHPNYDSISQYTTTGIREYHRAGPNRNDDNHDGSLGLSVDMEEEWSFMRDLAANDGSIDVVVFEDEHGSTHYIDGNNDHYVSDNGIL